MTAIVVDNLGKEYVLGRHGNRRDSFRDMLVSTALAPFRRLKQLSGNVDDEDRFWALQDLSFSVNAGEVVGVIGKNGAGKSTLLKLLSRITAPTTGRIDIRGRVGSLLEVGTGFHPELTGRENVFLNGAILGMSRKEIAAKFDEIVAFSEVERFLDTPVKRYSSGMYMRLAFAVAAHLEPEILVVDEVLAVGDVAFQKKCLGKMSDIAGEGRTVLFVSHNMGAVRRLCHRGIVLEAGRAVFDGNIEEAVATYLSSPGDAVGDISFGDDGACRPGVTDACLLGARVSQGELSPTGTVDASVPFEVQLQFRVRERLPYARAGFALRDATGQLLFDTYDAEEDAHQGPLDPGLYTSTATVPASFLRPGEHFIDLKVGVPNVQVIADEQQALSLRVEDSSRPAYHLGLSTSGSIRPVVRWTRSLSETSL